MQARTSLVAFRATLVAAGALWLLADMATAAGTVFDYTHQPRTFRACRLLLPGQTGDADPLTFNYRAGVQPMPHTMIFEGMRRFPGKPAGWEIENPLAPAAMVAGAGNVTKSMPAYWEVRLNPGTEPQLEGFDLIYIFAGSIDIGPPSYRDALMRAVHEGAVVWVDQPFGGTAVNAFAPPGRFYAPNPPASPFFLATSGQVTGSYRRADDFDMLLTYPFRMTDQEDVQFLGMFPVIADQNWPFPPGNLAESADLGYVTCNDPGYERLVSVFDPGANAWLPNVVIYRHGAGAVLITASNIGHDLVDWWLQRPPASSKPARYEVPDSKFAWNVMALTSAWGEQRGNMSQRGVSQAAIGLPLDVKWQYPDRFEPAGANVLGTVVSSPVVSGGLVFSLSLGRAASGVGPARPPLLMCFDKEPVQDLNADGQADDGIPDYALGRSYDMVGWTALNTGGDWTPRATSPTLASISGLMPGGLKLQVALVSLVQQAPSGHATGLVRCYNATYDARTLTLVPGGFPASFSTPGALMWERVIDTYDGPAGGGNGQVIELSTPAVYRNYVYVLSSELDEDADGVGGITEQDAYGRAHCFMLNYRWDLDANGPQWDYPEATDNPNGDGDVAGPNPPADDNAYPEPMKLLPPFQPPAWVAALNDGTSDFTTRPEIPPLPTQKPVPDQAVLPRNDYAVDAYLHFTAPVSVRWNNGLGVMETSPTRGGSDYCLLPTPRPVTAAPYTDATNDNYWLFFLPGSVTVADTQITSVVRADDPEINASANVYLWPVNGLIYAKMTSSEVREICLPSRGGGIGWRDPTLTSRGVSVTINYELFQGGAWVAQPPVTTWVRGLVPWRQPYADEWQRAAARGVENGRGYFSFDTWENDRGALAVVPGGSSYIESRRQDSGGLVWRYRPAFGLPDPDSGGNPRQLLGKPGMAVDRQTETAYAAVTMAVSPDVANPRAAVPEVLGLNTTPRLIVQLAGGGPDTRLRSAPAGPVVQTVTNVGGVPAAVVVPRLDGGTEVYTVDDESRAITFSTAAASWVNTNNVGPLWGKPIWVSYDYASPPNYTVNTTVNNEFHVLPDILRFQYTPGVARLNNTIVRAANVTAALPNGVPLAGLAFAEVIFPQASVPGAADPTWPEGFVWQGLLDVDALVLPGGEPLRPGSDIVLTYECWDPVTNQAVIINNEPHQVPVNFGESVSSPAVAGATVHIGTEGYHPTRVKDPADGPVVLDNNDIHLPAAATGPILAPNGGRKSLLSVLWDPVSRALRGALSQAAYPEPGSYGLAGGADQGTPVTTSSPAVDSGVLYVGSRLMIQLSQVASYQGQGLGFVSALHPQRTLVCDTARLVEVIGRQPSWVCVGSLAPDYHAAYQVNTQGADELKPTPFSRPAKAIYLENGHILVADTGNNRVVEIDRAGRQVWPLDANGYDYYTSPANTRLSLDRPADVYRYYTTVNGGVVANSRNGNMLLGTVTHTVVAEPGNARVVDIVTTVNFQGQQMHTVVVLTPDFTRLGTQEGVARISYTKAQPIFRPDNGEVVGYLCAASNLHQLVVVEAGTRRVNPPGTNAPAAGTFDWNWWAWLYDANLTDANPAPNDPLVFRNIRHVEFVQEEDFLYVTITCGQYAGRWRMVEAGTPHVLAAQGAGVFEFAINVGGQVGTWGLEPAVDVAAGTVVPDDPMWRFTTVNYTFSDPATNLRRQLANIRYTDADGADRWLPMGWSPVSGKRLAGDLRPTGAGERMQRHLVTNYAELIQNLRRDNVVSSVAPASLFSSVFAVETDDRNNNDPNDDGHDIDRREVIPDPHDRDWPDPFNQPTYAERQ